MMYIYKYMCSKQVFMQIEDAIEKNKMILNLKSLEIEDYPPELTKCKDVQKLYIQHNKLKYLNVDVLKNLPVMTKLNIDYNKIARIPNNIYQLTSLVDLNISYNPIEELPPEIGLLENLEALWCNCTGLYDLPEEIGKLKKLCTLGARGNKLRFLPKSLTRLRNLSWLTLENNLIHTMPDDMRRLRVLIHLNLKKNDFQSFPVCITKCKYLKYAFLNNNEIYNLDGLTKNDLNLMKSLIYIDIQDTPCVMQNIIPDELKNHPRLKTNKDWKARIEEVEENAEDEDVSAEEEEEQVLDEATSDDEYTIDSISIDSDDWETSIVSGQFDYADYPDNENPGFGFDDLSLQDVSRFAGTGN